MNEEESKRTRHTGHTKFWDIPKIGTTFKASAGLGRIMAKMKGDPSFLVTVLVIAVMFALTTLNALHGLGYI